MKHILSFTISTDFFEKHLVFELALLVLLHPDADRVLAFHCKDILHQ